MANGEWLTQLLSGLGGAFTGEVAARGRIAEEQEATRKQTEQQMERDRLKRIQTLRQQPFSKEIASQLLGEGDTPANVASYGALSQSFMPDQPKYSSKVVGQKGDVYFAEPGTGKSIRATDPEGKPLYERVPSTGPRETPLTRAQLGAGRVFYSQFSGGMMDTNDPQEAARRRQIIRDLEREYPGASPAEIGYYLMEGYQIPRRGTGAQGGTSMFSGRPAVPPEQ